MKRIGYVLFVLLFCCVPYIYAQQQTVAGVVFDGDGLPLPGATVIVKGTSKGTNTNFDGEFTIQVPNPNTILEVSFMGFRSKEIAANSKELSNIILEEDVSTLSEVVVTALGLTREKKSLGYSVTEVNSDELTKTESGNWLNSLSGKVAGLTLDNAGSGPTSSMRVTLRGEQSLNYGNNEALFVIDGVPVSSGTTATKGSSNYAQIDAPIDFGNAASEINPDDIESVTVLKGPAASALYGSRAGNGAIVITTKSGKSTKGLGVTINSSVTFEKAGYFPDFQTEYGNGSDNGLDPYSLWELSGDMTPDGVPVQRHYSRYTFGEKFDPEKKRYLYASKNWDTGEFTKLPWVYQDDWYTGFFKTGVTTKNSVTIQGGNGKGTSTRLSFTDENNDWIVPNTGYNKKNIALAFNTEINDFIGLTTNVTYLRKGSDNMPVSGYNESSIMYDLAWGSNVNSINDWKNEYFEGRYNYENYTAGGEDGKGLVFPSANSYNPYRASYEELSPLEKDRVYGSMGLNFKILEGLTLDVKSGLDWSNEFRTQRKPFLTTGRPNGFYREQTIRNYEFNNELLLQYVNTSLFNERLHLNVVGGANNRIQQHFRDQISLYELGDEGIYHTENLPSGVTPNPYNYRSKKKVNSLYGLVSMGWDDTYFLDITGRNDWSSTLSAQNWSFFYPSVASSILLDKVLNMKEYASWVDMLKLRVSWANVGNDTSPYSLDQYYGSSSFPGGYVLPGTITDRLIKPEKVESWEAGLEGMLFHKRISFDLALYYSSTTDQIVSTDLDQITGATGVNINAGEIVNKGLEISANFVPVRTEDFNWSFSLNWSRNYNKLVSLQDGWDPEQPLQTDMGTTIGGRTYIYSYLGEEMHTIYGRGYQRAPDGATYTDENGKEVDASGMHLVDSDGYPILDDSPNRRIGKVNPDWRAGMTQNFRYKNLTLSATFAGQYGGNTFSVTNFALSYQGKLTNSLPGRYDGLVHPGVNVIKDANGENVYTKNETVTSNIQTYYNSVVWNRNNTESNTFDTSFLKVKEIRLGYNLPKKIIQKTFIQDATVSVFGTNLWMWTDFPQYDPEGGMLNGSNIHKGIEAMTFPLTRSYGLNVKLTL